jgi:ABC-type hemin transport system substrate-binding protein
MEYDHRWHGMPPNREQYEKALAGGGGIESMAELAPMRKAYGEALVKLGHANPDVVVLSADVSNSISVSCFKKLSRIASTSALPSRRWWMSPPVCV